MSCCCGCAPGMHVALCAARHAPHVLTASQFLLTSSRCQFAKCSWKCQGARTRRLARMSAEGGLSMTATVSSDSTQLHFPWMVVCRNQHHANCQPVDAPAGTRSLVAPADDICRYRRDICDCQTEERGHWCASSSVYSERAYCSNAAHGDRRWHGRMLRDRFSDPASCLLLGTAFGDQ